MSELVLSHAPGVDEFRLYLYPARPCSAAENVPELLILHFLRLFSGFSSLAALLLPKRCESFPAAGSSAAKRLEFGERTCSVFTALCSRGSELVRGISPFRVIFFYWVFLCRGPEGRAG